MPTDTQVNDLKINVLTEAQYEQIQSPSATELYLVPDTVDTVPTQGSTNTITSGAVYSALQNIPAQEQSDWNESDTTDPAYIKNKPTLGTAAAKNVPTNGNASATEVVMGNDSRLTDARTPTAHTHGNITNDGKVGSASGKILTTGNGGAVQASDSITKSMISDFPSLATVATSGSYNDLSNKPTIPAAQVQTDWNATSGMGVLLNKPTIPAAQVNSDWNAASGVAQILNKPNLATVATSGSYDDLLNTPDLTSYVSGPSVATEDNIAVYDGTTGKFVKDADISVIRLYENVEYLDNTTSNHYYIARTTGKWAGSASNAHRILDLTNIRKVTITARSNREAQYTFLKSYTKPDSEDVGETPDYANGYTTVVQIAAGTTQSLTVPADANYLYILVSTSYTYTPTSLKITGIGITEHSGTGSGFVKDDGSVDNTSYEPALPPKKNNEKKVLAVGEDGTSLVWVKPVMIYSGTSEPSSSVGSDGDIYIKTTA